MCKNFSSLALTVWDLLCCEYMEEKDESINHLINHKAVYRTAPATPGLLKIIIISIKGHNNGLDV